MPAYDGFSQHATTASKEPASDGTKLMPTYFLVDLGDVM